MPGNGTRYGGLVPIRAMLCRAEADVLKVGCGARELAAGALGKLSHLLTGLVAQPLALVVPTVLHYAAFAGRVW